MEVNRPSQKKQTSRKGKKAWRKNIDIDDIEVGLEEQREDIRLHGEQVDQIDSNELFTVDTKGDETISKKKAVKPYKISKSLEILNARSKAPGLKHMHAKTSDKIQGVKKKEVHRLMKIAGRVQGETSSRTIVAKDGIINTRAYDVWGGEEEAPNKSKKKQVAKPEILEKLSSTSWNKPKHAPVTYKHAPLKVKEVETIPNAGKSYNPSLESWKALINKEYLTEKEKEDERQRLEQHRAKIQHLIETMEDNEESEDEDEENNDENDDEETAEEIEKSLSVNKVVVNKKKTKYKRNQEKKHKERMELQDELKELKQKMKELAKIPVYSKELIEKEELNKDGNFNHEKDLVLKRNKLGSKHKVIDDMLEVKLSDELNDSLRKLKTEGNLLYDQMKNLQSSGKIEARKQQKKRRRYNPKITEKWTYKDFK